jgi:hypothetical protein
MNGSAQFDGALRTGAGRVRDQTDYLIHIYSLKYP